MPDDSFLDADVDESLQNTEIRPWVPASLSSVTKARIIITWATIIHGVLNSKN